MFLLVEMALGISTPCRPVELRVNQNFKPSQELRKKTLKATDVDYMAASKTPQNTPGSPTAVNAPDMVK